MMAKANGIPSAGDLRETQNENLDHRLIKGMIVIDITIIKTGVNTETTLVFMMERQVRKLDLPVLTAIIMTIIGPKKNLKLYLKREGMKRDLAVFLIN